MGAKTSSFLALEKRGLIDGELYDPRPLLWLARLNVQIHGYGLLEDPQAALPGHGVEDDPAVVIRHDTIVYEWYAKGYGRHVPHYTASLAKALVGGITLIMALGDGLRIYANWGGAAYSPDAVARVGRLMLRKGVWEGRRILDPK